MMFSLDSFVWEYPVFVSVCGMCECVCAQKAAIEEERFVYKEEVILVVAKVALAPLFLSSLFCSSVGLHDDDVEMMLTMAT